jgi:hypothetical protein
MGINRLLKKSQKFLREKGIKDGLPGRTFVKSQGCWCCVHFDRGEIYEKRKIDTGLRDVRALAEQGRTQNEIAHIMAGREVKLEEAGAGICLGGGAKGDFVSARYMCDKWTGRVAIDRHGDGLDPLPEEIKDMLGDNSKPEPPSVDLEATKVLEAIAAARLGEGVTTKVIVEDESGTSVSDVAQVHYTLPIVDGIMTEKPDKSKDLREECHTAALCNQCFKDLGHSMALIAWIGERECAHCGKLCAKQGEDFEVVWYPRKAPDDYCNGDD